MSCLPNDQKKEVQEGVVPSFGSVAILRLEKFCLRYFSLLSIKKYKSLYIAPNRL